MVNCGAPIWDDYCPNKKCTGHVDEIRRALKDAKDAWEKAKQLRDAAPDMFEALASIANTYDDSWTVGSQERRIGDLARAAISKARP